MEQALAQLLDGRDLSRAESRRVMDAIMSGEATPAQIGGFLVALRLKGETADEIAGAAEAMRDHVIAVHPARDDLVDTAGTGGDGGRTFNISTAAALVAAAAGAGVAKHGNRSVSSQSGSADVLEELGFNLELPAESIARLDRRARLRLHVRSSAPSRDAPRRPGPARARDTYRLQRAWPAHEPGRRAQPGGRRLFGRARAGDRRCARPARGEARIRGARRRRHRRALPRRAEPRLRGRRGRGAPARDRPRRRSGWSAAGRKTCAAGRRPRTPCASAPC